MNRGKIRFILTIAFIFVTVWIGSLTMSDGRGLSSQDLQKADAALPTTSCRG